jgi:F-box/leucine-rich repeat protein 13
LKSFKVENNEVITDVSLRALSKTCRDMQVICLSGCSRITDQGLKMLMSAKKLQVLNIADCSRVSDAGIRYIVENTSGGSLRELNFANCVKISDVTPLRISQHCRNLIHLNISYCENISDTGVELLVQLPMLIDLNLTGCGITDHGIAILRHHKKLKYLDLAELPDITDDGISKMANGLNNLETINLSGCEGLTDSGVQVLAFKCQLLRKVQFAACPSIGDSAAKYISQGCCCIQQIDLSGTRITDQALRHLTKGCDNLTQIDILSCVHVTK